MRFWPNNPREAEEVAQQEPPPVDNSKDTYTTTEARLRRIETRLVQIMFHLGLNPYKKEYDNNGKRIKNNGGKML